jgi:hypothetical protein
MAVVLLTLLTQIGGLVLLLVWSLSRLALPRAMGAWRRAAINALLFVVAYAVISLLVVPPLAALAGRVPLPCRAQPDRAFAAGSVVLCALNRHYVVPDQVVLLNELSREIARRWSQARSCVLLCRCRGSLSAGGDTIADRLLGIRAALRK